MNPITLFIVAALIGLLCSILSLPIWAFIALTTYVYWAVLAIDASNNTTSNDTTYDNEPERLIKCTSITSTPIPGSNGSYEVAATFEIQTFDQLKEQLAKDFGYVATPTIVENQ